MELVDSEWDYSSVDVLGVVEDIDASY